MKNRFIHKILVVLVAFVAITSCSKDFLETDPIGKLAVDDFYKTDADAMNGLIAAYDILQWQNAMDWQSVYLAKTLPSDESSCGGSSSGDQPPLQEMDQLTFSSGNPVVRDAYKSNYYGIFRCNMVITKVEPINDFRKQIIAEAKVLRAYYYSELVMMFGRVPLILQELAPSAYKQPQAEIAAIYAQIELDPSCATPCSSSWIVIFACPSIRVTGLMVIVLVGMVVILSSVPQEDVCEFRFLAREQFGDRGPDLVCGGRAPVNERIHGDEFVQWTRLFHQLRDRRVIPGDAGGGVGEFDVRTVQHVIQVQRVAHGRHIAGHRAIAERYHKA